MTEVYNLEKNVGSFVYGPDNEIIGRHTGYAVIAHDAKSRGQICVIDREGKQFWLSGIGFQYNKDIYINKHLVYNNK